MTRMRFVSLFVILLKSILLMCFVKSIESSRHIIRSGTNSLHNNNNHFKIKHENRLSGNNNNVNSNNDLMEQILKTDSSSAEDDSLSSIYVFLDKLTSIGLRKACDASLIRSDIRDRIQNLKSLISTCSSYCRVAINPDGNVYGAKIFKLESLWERVDVSDELIIRNGALLGAFYLKFIYSNRYLCITKHGIVYSSVNKTNECLWFNTLPKLTSALYKNVNLTLDKNCNLESRYSYYRYVDNERINTNINDCTSNLKITSGPSPGLKKFYHTCQTELLGQNRPKNTNTNNNLNNNEINKSKSPVNTKFQTYTTHLTKKTIPIESNTDLLCANYLIDEILLQEIKSRSASSFTQANKNRMPQICIDYLIDLNRTQQIVSSSKQHLAAITTTPTTTTINQFAYSGESDQLYSSENIFPSSDETAVKNRVNHKHRKCYAYRNTVYYKKCMEKNYKCYRYNNDVESLKKCRKKYGITAAPRKSQESFA